VDGKRYSCNAQGGLNEAPCPSNQPCQTLPGASGPGSGTCGPKPCDNCDDANPCTSDACSDGLCTHTPQSAACDDGKACTSDDHCVAGNCLGTLQACDDGVDCTVDGCAKDDCMHAPDSAKCNDGNICTDDICDQNGCSHPPKGGPCEDGDGCATGGGCSMGVCLPGHAKACNDDNACTTDACVGGDCVHSPVAGGCDDGDACTVGDLCAQGICLSGAIRTCDDGYPCTLDACKDGACQHDLHGCPPGFSPDAGGLAGDVTSSTVVVASSSGGAKPSGCTARPIGANGSLLTFAMVLAWLWRRRDGRIPSP
jgi:hypothetical protein